MKTKHILTALALPAMFAACTAEDIVSENSSIQRDRAKLSENFALVVGADAVDSRYTVNSGKSEFETGDKIGAAIIDQFEAGKDVEDWTIIPSLAQNTPFTFDATTDVWSVPENQPMGIGNYFFKFPYNNADRSRGAVTYSLPVVQKQYVEEDGVIDTDAAVEAGNLAIAHAVLTEEDEMGDISLKNIFTYPKFRIQFDNGEKVNTVSKVVLYATTSKGAVKSEGFIVKSGFKHQTVVNLFNNADASFIPTDEKTTDWNLVQTNDLIYTTTPKNGVAEVEKSTYIIAQLPEDAEVSYDSNTENKYIEVRFVLPAVKDLSNVNLGMYVYTDNGMYKYADVADAIEFKKTTDDDVKNSVFARNKNYNLTLEVLDKAEKTEEKIVASNEDWNELVSVYGDVKKGRYDIVVVGDEFGFDETTEMPEVATFTIKGNAIVKGEVTFSNVIVDGDTYVEEGAVLTTSGSFASDAIYNEGEVVIAQVLEGKNVDNYEGVASIYNAGTLTINEKTEATFALFNAEKSVVENNGEINIENALIEEVAVGNYGTIENKGVINLTGNFTNEEEEWNTAGTKIVNMPTINNEGEIFAKKGNLTNNGTINNEEDAVMTCKNQDGEINNSGILNVVDGSVTYITSNANGTINVDKAVPAELIVKSTKGTIAYNAEGTESFKNSLVNTITVTDDIKITDKGSVETIFVDSDAELTFPAAASITSLTIKENAVATLKSGLTVANLYVKDDAELIVPADVKLEVTSSTFDNAGVIRVAGTLNALKVQATAAGTVKDNGTSATINFYDKEADDLQKTWNAAVAAWAKGEVEGEGWYFWYSNNKKNDAGQAYYAGNPYEYEAFYAVATNSYWKERDVIAALNGKITAPEYNTDGSLKSTTAVKAFVAAVDALLKAQAEDAAEVLYNAKGEFTISMSASNTCFETVAEMYDNMSTRLNTVAIIEDKFAEDAVMAAYTWYAQSTVFAKINATMPYAYVWKSTADLACPLYDVCQVIKKANAEGWEKIMGNMFDGEINTIGEVQLWLTSAAAVENTTTLGKLAKEMADKYYTASLTWGYTTDQATACLASK